jgi:hypothetical protein
MSDHIPDVTKMIGETPRTDAAYFKPHATMYDLAGEMKLMERELNAANSKIEALNRGNAAAERILCDAAGVGSGRDVLEWIVAANDRIKRLEEVGDDLESWLDRKTPFTIRNNWRKAKEAKP